MYSTNNLGRLFEEVSSDLQKKFGYDIGDEEVVLLDASKPEDMKALKKYAGAGKMSKEAKSCRKSGMIFSMYIGTSSQNGYMIAVPGTPIQSPMFGKEIIQCEHRVMHQGTGSDLEYRKRFSFPTTDLIGMIGAGYVAKHGRNVLNLKQPAEVEFSEDTVSHYIACATAGQIVKKRKIPYEDLRDILHTETEQTVWRAVNRILIPEIRITVPKGAKNNACIKNVMEYLDSMGLETRLKLLNEDDSLNAGDSAVL